MLILNNYIFNNRKVNEIFKCIKINTGKTGKFNPKGSVLPQKSYQFSQTSNNTDDVDNSIFIIIKYKTLAYKQIDMYIVQIFRNNYL